MSTQTELDRLKAKMHAAWAAEETALSTWYAAGDADYDALAAWDAACVASEEAAEAYVAARGNTL